MDNVDEARIRERDMYQSILDETTAQITIIDAETYRILYANKAALDVTKDMPGTYIGSVCYDFIRHSNQPCPHCMIAKAKREGYESREVEYGNRIYNQLYKMIEWNGRSALMEYTEDITEQRKLAQVMLEMELAKRESKAKSEFLTRMSHDIRTPMNAIINMTRFAREDYLGEGTGDVLDDLEKVENTSNYLLGLINDILDVSRIESGNLELHPVVYDYEEFASYLYCMIRPLCEKKNIEFVWDMAKSYKPLWVDKVRFNQMMFNLLSNAVKYTPEGGTVTLLEYDNVVNEEGIICSFSVIDSGCGMSKEFQKKMFEPFTREESGDEIQGTGLGLTIVKKIAEVMNGTLTVESEKGVGSTFTVRVAMPFATPKQVEEAKQQASMDKVVSHIAGKSILVAEDHPLNMKIIVRLLSMKGIKVIQAINGEEVVRKFEKSIPGSIDTILMDLRMPVYDGIEATKIIRSSKHLDAKKIPIIAMTANAFEEDKRKSLEAGMTDYLTKPVEPDTLYRVLLANLMEK